MNCLVNPTDPNYFVAFAENSIDLHGCPTAISDNLFQDTHTPTHPHNHTPTHPHTHTTIHRCTFHERQRWSADDKVQPLTPSDVREVTAQLGRSSSQVFQIALSISTVSGRSRSGSSAISQLTSQPYPCENRWRNRRYFLGYSAESVGKHENEILRRWGMHAVMVRIGRKHTESDLVSRYSG